MDPETVRLLITALVGFSGAFVGFFSAQRVAGRTLEAQRQLATDEAVRRWRTEDVRPMLDALTHEMDLYQRLAKQRARGAAQQVEQLIEELANITDWHIYSAALRNIASPGMSAALAQLDAAGQEIHALLVPDHTLPLSEADLRRVFEIGGRMSIARAAIRDAAALYVTMPRPPQPGRLPPPRP